MKLFLKHYQKSLDAGRLTNHGPNYMELNKIIEKRMSHNAIVANATIGLELALRARFKPGSKIGLPTFTFKATYLAVINAGMIPVVFQCSPRSWVPYPDDISGVDGMIVVSPFGYEVDIAYWESINIPIVYDFAGAWGLDYRGPNIAVYSLHATKNFCVGEGAIIVSQDLNMINEITRLSNFGYTNAKISEMACAMALAILEEGVRYPKYHYSFERPCTLDKRFASLFVVEAKPEHIYELLNNGRFECRRYYNPLIEDMAPQYTKHATSVDHITRSLVALPRDVTKDEADEIEDIAKKFLVDP